MFKPTSSLHFNDPLAYLQPSLNQLFQPILNLHFTYTRSTICLSPVHD